MGGTSRAARGAREVPERAPVFRIEIFRTRHRSHAGTARRPHLGERPHGQPRGHPVHGQPAHRRSVQHRAQGSRRRLGALVQAAELRRHADRRLQPALRRRAGGGDEGRTRRGRAAAAARHRRRRAPARRSGAGAPQLAHLAVGPALLQYAVRRKRREPRGAWERLQVHAPGHRDDERRRLRESRGQSQQRPRRFHDRLRRARRRRRAAERLQRAADETR